MVAPAVAGSRYLPARIPLALRTRPAGTNWIPKVASPKEMKIEVRGVELTCVEGVAACLRDTL